MNYKSITLLILLIFTNNIKAQQIGSWRMHFNYDIAQEISYSETKILSANKEAILVLDIDDNSIRELDKSNSLSDIGINKLAYCKDEKTFIIAYNSTNIDLLTDDFKLTNIPDLQNKITSVSKNINDIFIYNSTAYFSTDLGIVVLDIKNQEIDNTFIIGNEGDPSPVLDCVIFEDTIYALVKDTGTNSLNNILKTAYINDNNLLDFANWKENQVYFPFANAKNLEIYNNALYITVNNKIYKKENGNWKDVFTKSNLEIVSLKSSEKLVAVIKEDSLGIALDEQFLIIGKDGTDTIKNKNTIKPYVGIVDTKGTFYIGDLGWGLIDYDKNNRLSPSGKPFSSDIYAFSSRKNKVFASAGSLQPGVVLASHENINGFYYFSDFKWHNINRFTVDGLDDVINFVDVKENPINGKVYGATTTGLVEYDYDKIIVYDTTNSLLDKQIGSRANLYVTGVDFDSKGNIWLSNSHTYSPLKVLTKDGDWYKYNLATGSGGSEKYGGLFVDSYDQIWVRTNRKGLSVFPALEELSGPHDNESILINTNTANLPNDYINTIAEDKNGSIWVGTNEGIAVFDCPENIFDENSDCIISRRIKSTLDEYTEYLFGTDQVNAIAVDGANRKWIGTSAGLWLVSETGEKVLLSFNTENSPLPSNEIYSIAIDEQTGEVFIATSEGMASYVSDATEPSEDISNIKAFPNPVAPDYFGTISVTGLTANSYVKITDISGTLIDDGYALGGKYVWDGKDYNGTRASTGVYLVFSADNKNKNKAVAKIVFIN